MFPSHRMSKQDPCSHPVLWLLLPENSLNASPSSARPELPGLRPPTRFLPSGLLPPYPFSTLLPGESRIWASSLCRGRASLLCILPILVRVPPKPTPSSYSKREPVRVASVAFRTKYGHKWLSVTWNPPPSPAVFPTAALPIFTHQTPDLPRYEIATLFCLSSHHWGNDAVSKKIFTGIFCLFTLITHGWL